MPEKYAGWLSKAAVAVRLGLSTKSIDRAIRVGQLKAAERPMVGRRPLIVIDPADVARVEAERVGKRSTVVKFDTGKLFFTLREAAAFTGLTQNTLQSLMIGGRLPFLELEEGLRIRRKDLESL